MAAAADMLDHIGAFARFVENGKQFQEFAANCPETVIQSEDMRAYEPTGMVAQITEAPM